MHIIIDMFNGEIINIALAHNTETAQLAVKNFAHEVKFFDAEPPIGEAYNDEWTAYYEKLKQHILYTGRELTWMDNVEPMDKSC